MKNFVVSKSEKGDFNSISEALAAASDGDKIFVQGGTYNESFVINKAVELSCDENEVAVVSIESGTVCKVSAGANIKFIHFNNRNGVQPDIDFLGFHALVEVSADAVFENCDFSGSFDGNIQVYGSGVKAQFINCSVRDANRNGMYFIDGCEAVVRGCDIYDNGHNGISIVNSSPVIEDCIIHDVKSNGLFVLGNCAEPCRNYGEGESVVVCPAAPVVSNCDIYNLQESVGVLLFESKCTLRNCKIHGISGSGIMCMRSADPIVEGCDIYGIEKIEDGEIGDMEAVGISICENSKGIFRNCRIHEINDFGIFCCDNANPLVEDCDFSRFYDWNGAGIKLTGNSSGVYRRCKIHIIYNGICLSDNGDAVFNDCDIYDCRFNEENGSRGSCISFYDESYGEFDKCRLYDVQGDGILVVSSRKPVFSDCLMEEVAGTAVQIVGPDDFEEDLDDYGDSIDSDDSSGSSDSDDFSGSGNSGNSGEDFLIEDGILKGVNSKESEIIIPDGVTKINDDAFDYCFDVEKIFIPESVNDIGKGAFYNCINIKKFDVHDNNKVFCSVDGALLSKDKTVLVKVPTDIEDSYIIPEEVTHIGYNAFGQCSNLKCFNIPDSIVSIDDYAFFECKNLENIILPEGLKEISENCFYWCSSLKHVYIPNSVETIGVSAFQDCGLSECFLPEGLKEIKSWAFSECNNIRYIKLPKSLEKLGTGAFNCQSLVKIDVPDSCNAFTLKDGVLIDSVECAVIKATDISISSFVVPDGIKCIKENAFENCKNLKNIKIPESVTEIGDCAFSGCVSLKDIVLPDNLEKLGTSVFKDCKSLEYMKLPECVDNFYELFSGCTRLKDVKICSNKVTELESNAFEGCSSLTSIVIPEAVERINLEVFKDCTNLQHVFFNKKLSVIEINAFINCSSLSEISLPEGLTNIGTSCFENSGLKEVKLPESVTEIGSGAFASLSELTSVTIPANLSKINPGAFTNCDKLRNIDISSENENYIVIDDSLITKDRTVLLQYISSGKKSYTVPDGVKIIATGAFKGNVDIENVILPEGLSQIEYSAFENCVNLKNINIPESISVIGQNAFYGCNLLESVIIPKNIVEIGDDAFFGIDRLSINIK